MKKAGRKRKTSQYKFRRQVFQFDQYWLMYFTERYPDETEKDFMSVIKARSYREAIRLLKNKSKADDSSCKIKAILGYMLHKEYRNTKTKKLLSIAEWEKIRASAFPNLNDVLFKKELPRPEGYTNRFNSATAEDTKGRGFKKGEDNWSRKNRKGIYLPVDQRKGKKWRGDKWVQWDKEEMNKTKDSIVHALILNDNNRFKTADYLKMGRTTLYRLMARCEHPDWWRENFPIAKRIPPRVSKEERSATQKRVMAERKAKGLPFFDKSKAAEAKRIDALKKAKAKTSLEYKKTLIPKIQKALLANDNIRTKAAESLGVKVATFKRWMEITKDLVDWVSEYPSNYHKCKNTP